MDMRPDPYDALMQDLAGAGLVGQRQNDDQLVVSRQEGPVWPNRGNSFWVSQKAGVWYLSTWLPAGYRVPAGQDILAVCLACMSVGTSAMWRVPAEIVARFGLEELNETEYERLFQS